jgi:hypothetical protein
LRVTAHGGVNAAARLRPRNRRRGSRIDSIEARSDFGGPRSLGVGIYFGIEALNELACKGGPFVGRKPQCFNEQLLRIHA